MLERLSFKDLLLIAEATLGVPYDRLEETVCVFRAESALAAPFARLRGADLHPDPVERATLCATRLIRSQPFLFGNREVGYECMREMLVLEGCRWLRQDEEAKHVEATLNRLEVGTVTAAEFLRWARERVTA
ncbi:MAG TPA: hypothetical protein VD761_08555 [Solirubrobacterales bacterium]|nr:hypothetical protein [Solirubrobacterales bacterium]